MDAMANSPSIKGNLEGYFEQPYPFSGRFDLPLVKPQPAALNDLKLIRFTSTVRDENSDLDATVHFFEEDERFDEVWKSPAAHLAELGQYRQVLTPDFSVYAAMPLSEQLFNTFRNRWCGWFWQQHGMTAIPTVTWGDARSFEFCFDGMTPGSVVAVSTIGAATAEAGFMAGYRHMCRTLAPEQVICYGRPFSGMFGLAAVVEVPYSRDTRTAERKSA
jgi:hypothetical protein